VSDLPGTTANERKVKALDVSQAQVLCDAPRVVLTLAAVDPLLVTKMISVARPRLSAALVSDAGTGSASNGRTCHACWFPHDADPTVRAVVDGISAAAGMDSRFGEQLHVIRYTVGGQYKPHFDGYRLDTQTGQRCTRRRGQRTHTAILYLNDGMTGGATIFPRLGLEIPAAGGAVLTFENCVRGTVLRDESSLHAGAPVEEGEKWIATLWFRELAA
jgi:prolyl 4-hydroxylase